MLKSVQFKVLDPRLGTDWPLPHYQTTGSAAIDLRACLDETLHLPAQQTALLHSGVAMHIADPQWAALVLPRSGLGHHQGLVLSHGVGLIDSDYQGEIMIACWNRSQESLTIEPGTRVAQCLLIPVAQVKWLQVDDFVATTRGEGGFGHTGTM